MNSEEKIKQQVNAAMNSLNSIRRMEINEALVTNIFNSAKSVPVLRTISHVLKYAVAASITILLALNIYAALNYQSRQEALNPVYDEYFSYFQSF